MLVSTAIVWNLGTTFVSPQFHVIFDENFSTIQNNTKLEDTAAEPIFNGLFESCWNHYVEEGRPPEGDKSAPEGAVPADPPMELGGEWLTEAEQRDKSSRNETWRSNQHKIRFEQAKDFERLNDNLDPTWPLDDGDVPSAAFLSGDESNASDG